MCREFYRCDASSYRCAASFIGVPRNFEYDIIADKRKFINNFV